MEVVAEEIVQGRPGGELELEWTGTNVKVLPVWAAGAGWWGPQAGGLSRWAG